MATARRLPIAYNENDYGTGLDYTLLSTWEQATDNDLVTATKGEILNVFLNSAGGALWNDSVVISGATTDASYFRVVRCAPSVMHSGIPADDGTVAGFKGDASGVTLRGSAESYVAFYDLCCTHSASSAATTYSMIVGNYGKIVGGLLFDGTNPGAGNASGVYVSNSTGALINTLILNYAGDGIWLWDQTPAIYNCTFAENNIGLTHSSGTGVVVNCLVENNTTNYAGTWTKTQSTDDGGVTFLAPGSDDYHLHADDDGNFEGNDLSADGTYAFDDDIDGDTRSDWDRGFDEYLAAAALTISVSDSIAAAETIGPSSPLAGVSRFDNAIIQEIVTVLLRLLANTSETITVTDVANMVLAAASWYAANVSDTVDVSENIGSVMSGDATSVSDLVQLAESISSVMSAATDVNDNIEVSEGVDSLMSGGVGVASEVVEVVENVTSVMSGDAASTSEILEIAEDITMALGVAGWPFNVYDVLTILEDIQARTDLADVGIFDSLEIQESLTLSLTSLVTPTPVAKKTRRGSGGAARPAIKKLERLLREDEELSLTIMSFVRWFHERST